MQSPDRKSNQPSNATRNWLFDPTSGYALDFSQQGAVCQYTNFHQDLEKFKDVKIVHRSDMKGYYRRYGLEPLVKDSALNKEVSEKQTGAISDERCPKCNKKGLLFVALQLRSADEGQTVLYECSACRYKYAQNN